MSNKRARALSPTAAAPSSSSVAANTSSASIKKARTSAAATNFKAEQVTSLDEFKLDLEDADVYYVEDFVSENRANEWYEAMAKLDTWYQPKLKVYGKTVTQSREIAAYATDPKLTLKYSGQVVDMCYEYPPLLRAIQDEVEERLGVAFNHVMLNKYDNGSVYIGNHRDNKENRVIASLSLGAVRTFIMCHDSLKKSTTSSSSSDTRKRKKWQLANGSLVVMQGDTQKYYKHEIPKEPKIKDGRISLTFRQLEM